MIGNFCAQFLRLSRKTIRCSIFLVSLLALSGYAHAEVIAFNSGADLAPFTVQTSDGALNFGGTAGVGTPAGGGLTFAGTTSGTEHSGIVYRSASFNATSGGTFRTSIYLNFKEFLRTDGEKDKGEIRIGFTTATTVNASSPHEFFNKTNPGFSLRLSAEHQLNSTDRKIEAELSSFTTTEGKYLKKTANASPAFTNWLKVTFTAVRTGASTFDLFYTVEDCGADGSSVPSPIAALTAGPQAVTHASFGSDTSIFAALLVRPDKYSTATTYLDNYEIDVTATAPAIPVAGAASQVSSSGLTANWQAGSGVAAESYIVEVTTAADNFAPNTFIAADGATGQSGGILVGNAAATSVAVSNLVPATGYVYRVRGLNTVGMSAPSNVAPVTTLEGNVNSAPTLDPIQSQIPIRPVDPSRTITLTGITAGGEANQTVSISAVSSDPAILPNPVINYVAPANTATLTYDPSGTGTGDVTITVTVNDGQSANNIVTRSFTVAVKNPQPLVGFESAAELLDLDHEPVNGNVTRMDGIGTGTPPSGGLVFEGTVSGSDRGAAVWRVQPYSGITSTNLHASIFFNAREVDNLASKDKGEIQIGFASTTNITAKPQEFLTKANPGLSVKLKVEHDPSEAAKFRQLETEVVSFDGFIETKGQKLTLINSTAIDRWLKVSFDAVRTGAETYRISYKVEDWGTDGIALAGVLMESTPITVNNATIAADAEIWAAFSVVTEKNGVAKVYVDQFEATAEENPPVIPVAQTAVQVTSNSFLANWQPGDGVLSSGWVLDVSTAANNFAPGTLLGPNGETGRTDGIVVTGATKLSQRISGLNPSTQYVYRVRGTNQHGISGLSNAVNVTTLVAGQNSAPTLDPISNPPALNINSSQQTVTLTGISAGGEANQFATITAVSSNPTLVPDPSIDYSEPDETGTLSFVPNEGQTGTATITVTVDDGQPANSTITRTFTITVVEPQTLIGFNDSTALDRLSISNFAGSQVNFGANAGVGSPAGGGAVFSRSGSLESVAVAFRQTAYDARVAPHLTASIMINVREIVGLTTGKDKAELRLAFAGSDTPNEISPKDSLNKTLPALGLALKIEHQVGATDKDRKVEVEMFSYNGTNESKGSKQSALRVAATANWIQVNLYLVRAGQDQYYLVYGLEDYGVNGTAWQGQVLTGGPFLVTNAPFFNDETVYAGFSLTPEKTSVANIYLDNYEVNVNTTASDAPLALSAGNVRAKEFTANWAPSAIGYRPDGYLLEVSKLDHNFAPGSLISAVGVGGQSSGIAINNASTTSLKITGLIPGEEYVYRIRAKRDGELSAIAGKTFVTTLPTDLAYWREVNFAGQLNDPAVSGPSADIDQDNIPNLMEYALGMNPTVADVSALPKVDVSGDYLRLTYKRRRNAPDIVYVPEASGDLQTWSMNVTEVYVSAPDAAGMETVIVEDNVPITDTDTKERFMRLKVVTLE